MNFEIKPRSNKKNKNIAIANPICVKFTPAIPVCQISKNRSLKFSTTLGHKDESIP